MGDTSFSLWRRLLIKLRQALVKGHLDELNYILQNYKLPQRIVDKLEIRKAIVQSKIKSN